MITSPFGAIEQILITGHVVSCCTGSRPCSCIGGQA
jgi:hypothetical protein